MQSNEWYWGVLAVVIILAVAFYTAHVSHRARQLRAHGLAATGKILAIKQTGGWSGNNPVVAITLEISLDGEPPHAHTLERAVPVVHAPSIQPGQVLRLKIDPAKRDRMVIDEPWAAPDA